MTFALSIKPDGTCTLNMFSTEESDGEPLISKGTWSVTGKTGGSIVWDNDKPDSSIVIAVVNKETITLSSENDVVTFKKRK